MLETFTAATFQPCVGQDFIVSPAASEPLGLRLLSCSELPDHSRKAARRPFSLIFRGSLDRPLSQQTYPFQHPALGSFDLFIVPVGRDDEGLLYEAVFS